MITFNIYFLFLLILTTTLTNSQSGSSRRAGLDYLACPRGCNCLRETITCQNANLPSVPLMPRIVPGPNGGPLQFLIFTYNRMSRLESRVFLGMDDVIMIDLANNKLQWVAKGAFVGLPSLRSLSLRGNGLQRLHPNVFSPIPRLDDLDLSANNLTSLPYSLEGLIFLRRLQLFGNPLHCPCSIIDFGLALVNIEDIRYRVSCMSPPDVAHYTLQELVNGLVNYAPGSTRLMGYQALNVSGMSVGLRPYIPEPPNRYKRWYWTHCPVGDFGGRAPISQSNNDNDDDNNRLNEREHGSSRRGPIALTFKHKPRDLDTIAGESTRFICVPDAESDLQITWILPGNASRFISLFRRRQILQIKEIHDYHQGRYTCIASNNNTQIKSSAILRIVEPIKPQVSDAPPADNNAVVVGSNLALRCSVSGRPRPSIEWIWQKTSNSVRLLTSGRYTVRNSATYDDAIGLDDDGDDSSRSRDERLQRFTQMLEAHSLLLIRNVTNEDAEGRYICYASNWAGSARVSTVLKTVKMLPSPIASAQTLQLPSFTSTAFSSNVTRNDPIDTSSNVSLSELSGEALVRSVIAKAQKRIEAAIKKTGDRLRANAGRRSAADIASLFRQPNRAALELAKAAEVYEAAIDEVTSILRVRDQRLTDIGTGSRIDGITEQELGPHDSETLGVQLTTEQLAIISQLSGCQQSTSIDRCSRHLCFHLRFRSIDGSCNNFRNPKWGAALAPLKRLLAPAYENGINTPVGWSANKLYFGFPKPSARLVSRKVLGNSAMLAKHTEK